MNIEKWISYLIACLTMIIIAFNLIGAIWMIVLDKKADIVTLRSLGMPDQSIQGIFLKLGFLIGLLGLVIGMIFSLSFYILQKKFHIIAVPDGFIMQGYPIELNPIDFLIVSVTVLCIALVAALLPSKRSVQVAKLMKSE